MSDSLYNKSLKPTMDASLDSKHTDRSIVINNLVVLIFIALFGLCYLFCPIDNPIHNKIISILIALGGFIVLFQWSLYRNNLRQKQDNIWFSTIVNSIADSIITVDCQGKILFASPSMEELSGYSSNELADKSLSLLVPDHLVHLHEMGFQKTISEGVNSCSDQRVETLFKHRSGKLINVELSYRESIFQGKRVFVGILRNISERIQAEAERRKLALAVQNSPSGVMITDSQGEIEYANPKLLQMTGFSSEDVIGENPRIFSSQEKTREEYQKMWQTLLSGNSWYDEFKNKRKDGSHYWVIASIAPMYDDYGRLTHFVSVQEDITSIKQANQAMADAKKIAETALKARSEFLSNMHHELRTPLNAIIGFTQLLDSDPDSPLTSEQSECTTQILHSGQHLLALINEVLDLAKAEAGQYQITPINIHALSIAKDSISMVKNLAEQNRVKLKLINNGDTLPPVFADPNKLKQVMINLLSNAAKYNQPGGEVTVNIEVINSDCIRISVQDTGMGIPTELQDQVFQPFNRLNAEGSDIEGTGIGLALCKNLVELMNGNIGFISEEGQGSTFWIDLPRAEH